MVALSLGDPNGIGPEIALKALAALEPAQRRRVEIHGPASALWQAAQATGLTQLLEELTHVPGVEVSPSVLVPGRIDPEAGRCAVASARSAIEACLCRRVSAVVAAPHHETAIAQAGIEFSGYPGLLAQACGRRQNEVFLMLVGGGLRVVHVTLHESVEQALDRLTPELVVAAALAGLDACGRIGAPAGRISLFGINPHASEGELFGPHDARCTVPAARRLRNLGFDAPEPRGADVLLSDPGRRADDLHVAMFHDQGHIPVKLLAPQGAVALSIGAGVLLASTGHGSAMDIAGTGKARPDALLRSLRLVLGSASDPRARA